MATGTTTIELAPIPPPAQAVLQKETTFSLHSNNGHTYSPTGDKNDTGLESSLEQASPPPEAVEAKPQWNKPRRNIGRFAAIFFAFINFGMNDACYGALLPYIQKDYGINYTVSSLVFLVPFVGYIIAALISDRLHMLGGRSLIAILAPCSRLLSYIVISTHPPFPVVAGILFFAGIGNGLLDGAWNAWAGDFASATQLMGLIHGCYGAGATISPAIATAMVTKYGCGWWQFFFVLIGSVFAEILLCGWAFWSEDGASYRLITRGAGDSEQKGMTRTAMKKRTTWVAAAFLFTYMGVEVSTGGYIVSFMTDVRHSEPFSSGLTATGFWLGLTMGRVILGFVTPKIGERLAVIIYLIIATGMELLFWLVPQFIVSAIAIAIVGFFIGPFFPAAVLMASRLLPSELHVASIGLASALGGSGAALLPFVVGAIVQASGVKTLQPIILALLVVLLAIWLCFPRVPKHLHQN